MFTLRIEHYQKLTARILDRVNWSRTPVNTLQSEIGESTPNLELPGRRTCFWASAYDTNKYIGHRQRD